MLERNLLLQTDFANVADSSIYARRAQAIVETASTVVETHHKPDVYFYQHKDGKLYSPTAKRFVEDVTLPGTDLKLLKKLQNWSGNNSAGMAIWVSPPLDTDNPSTKITVSEIWSGRYIKQVKNTAQLAEVESPTELANALLAYSINPIESVINEEELREKLIIVKDSQEAWKLISAYVNHNDAWEIYKEFIKTSKNIYAQHPRDRVGYANAMQTVSGNFRLGCQTISSTPTYGWQYSFIPNYGFIETISFSFRGEGKWVENCGSCGVEIKKKIPKGYECEHCHGVYQGC